MNHLPAIEELLGDQDQVTGPTLVRKGVPATLKIARIQEEAGAPAKLVTLDVREDGPGRRVSCSFSTQGVNRGEIILSGWTTLTCELSDDELQRIIEIALANFTASS